MHQRLDVFGALAQRRQMNLKTVDAIEQIRAKRSVSHYGINVAVGRRDDAHVDFNFAHAAHAEKCARLDCSQQFRLQAGRQFRHFIQEKRTAVRQFNQSQLARLRAGKGAGLIAEQLRLQQRFLERRAVQIDERSISAMRETMDGLGD